MNPNDNNVPPVNPLTPPAPIIPPTVVTPTPAPVVPPPPMTPPPTFSPAPVGKKSHLKMIIALVVILLIVGGGAVFAQKAGLFSSPEKAVKDAFIKTSEAKTVRTAVTLDVAADIPSGKQAVQIVVEGVVDQTDKENPNLDAKLKFTGFGLMGDADLKVLNKTFYFKINQFPMLAAAPMEVLGKWFSFTEKEIEEFGADYGVSAATLEKLKQKPVDPSEIFDLAMSHNVISAITSEGFSTKNGSSVKSYKVIIDKDALGKLWIAEAEKILTQEDMGDIDAASLEQYKTQLQTMVNASLAIITIDPIIVDVGVTDGMIHGISTKINMDSTKFEMPDTAKIIVNANISIVYSDFNKTVTITAPTNATPIMDLIKQSLGDARAKGTDAYIKANISSLRSSSEIYWDKSRSYAGLCTNDTMVKDVFEGLKEKGSASSCTATAAAYAISAQLTDATYFCVDSTGKTATLSKAPAGTVCK